MPKRLAAAIGGGDDVSPAREPRPTADDGVLESGGPTHGENFVRLHHRIVEHNVEVGARAGDHAVRCAVDDVVQQANIKRGGGGVDDKQARECLVAATSSVPTFPPAY